MVPNNARYDGPKARLVTASYPVRSDAIQAGGSASNTSCGQRAMQSHLGISFDAVARV